MRLYNEVTGWAKDYDQQLYTLLTADEQKAKAIFAIGRGGAKPRKDIAIWSEVKDYLAFFYDELYGSGHRVPGKCRQGGRHRHPHPVQEHLLPCG